MLDNRVSTHRSTEIDKPLEERLSIIGDLKRAILSDFANPVQRFESDCDGPRVFDSLHDTLMALTTAELRESLRSAGVARVPRGPKAKLVDLLYEKRMPKTADGFFVDLVPFGSACVEQVRDLVSAGGRREVAKKDIADESDVVPSMFPATMLFDTGESFVEVVPSEALEVLGALTYNDWDRYVRMANTVEDALRYVSRAVDLRGIAAIDDAVAEWGQASGIDEGVYGIVAAALRACGPWLDEADVAVISDNTSEYVLTGAMVVHVERDDGSIDDELVDEVLEAHEDIEPHAVSRELLDALGVLIVVFMTPEAREFVRLLDEYVPEDTNDSLFSLYVAMTLINDFRIHDDPTVVDKVLADEGLHATGDLAAQIHLCASRLNRVVPKWRLNGWTIAELDERQGRQAALMAAEGGNSEPSGFAWLDPQDDPVAPDDEEQDVDTIEAANDAYLKEFEEWLTASGLKPKTLSRHINNLDFYLNYYLAEYEGLPMPYGVSYVGPFLGGFFIRKAMWSTPATVRSMAASIKKFYKCMYERGHVDKRELDFLLAEVKADLPEWCDICAEYNDPYSDNPFAPW